MPTARAIPAARSSSRSAALASFRSMKMRAELPYQARLSVCECNIALKPVNIRNRNVQAGLDLRLSRAALVLDAGHVHAVDFDVSRCRPVDAGHDIK